ncbi:hypothetical protein GOBAR_AA29881 [Gossypium barbadense]|uniref:Uncharacterized protein n=1 Tax=Gossypium barbadense TaxID=3634 RepID=A0A2P5WI98_GOSBA|nr:hypothetical protein GOBAR_AA29881 [Gossypium barbadense]
MVREVGLAMRCRGAQRCQDMKPPHELDERVVVAESVVLRAVGGYSHQECPRRLPHRDGGRTDALKQLGLYEAVLGAKVCQHFKGEKCMRRLRACSSFSSLKSSIYRPSAAPNSGTLSWQFNPSR